MTEKISSRERMLLAIRNQQPDRVPVAPDISNMIPARRTGQPFWEIYMSSNPPLWKAYIDAANYFGMDGWFIYSHLNLKSTSKASHSRKTLSSTDEGIRVRDEWQTPAGDLFSETIYHRDMPPTNVVHPMKDFKTDFEKWRYLIPTIEGYKTDTYDMMKAEVGELSPVPLTIGVPGFHSWCNSIEGSIEALTYAYYDYPELFEEWRVAEHEKALQVLDFFLEVSPDYVFLGASGLLTMQSPEIFRHLSLPTMKEATRRCKEAGIPTLLHSCGKQRYLVEVLANETDLNCMNPLEMAPMGDCDLREIKQKFGHRMALMGNLHTTDTMLRGTPDDVEKACLEALDAAKAGGGFILSTGDQCGRDTPDENIFRMVQVAKEYGKY